MQAFSHFSIISSFPLSRNFQAQSERVKVIPGGGDPPAWPVGGFGDVQCRLQYGLYPGAHGGGKAGGDQWRFLQSGFTLYCDICTQCRWVCNNYCTCTFCHYLQQLFFFLYYNPFSKVCLFLSVSVSSKFELFEDIFHTKPSQRSKVKAVIG